MVKSKRLQIPVSTAEEKLIRSAARIYKISAAEWARRILAKAATRDLGAEVIMDPLEAVQAIAAMSLPISDDASEMNDEGVRGRLR